MMFTIKKDVLLYGLRPEMVFVHLIVMQIFEKHSTPLNITSARDSADGRVSRTLHDATTPDEIPVCLAIDYSSVHIVDNSIKQRILQDLKTYLPFCDVVLHSVAGSVEHFHIEFDPKNDTVFQAKKAAWKNGDKVEW